jgi:nucleoside-diphosphate-sugar epimerase
LVGAPLCARDEIGAITTNRDAIGALVERLSKDQWLIFPTTNSGYGIGAKDTYCTEDTPLNPISLYGRTKCEAEKIVLDAGRGVTLRLATVFGMSPRIRLDLLVNDFTYRAVNDGVVVVFEGHFRRNYIHVRDVAKAFLHVIANYDKLRGEPYNVGLSDANLTKLELCERIKKYVPNFTFMNAPIGKDPDQRDYIISNAKIEATGFRPDWSLDRGIVELLKAYRMLRNSNFSNV